MGTRKRPFHCGSQDADWVSANCVKCNKFHVGKCEISDALTLAYFNDGEVTEEIATRMGVPDDGCVYCWPCPEREEA